MPRAGSWSGRPEAELTRLREAVRRADPDAIAISLLFSFANPENEAAVAAAVAELGKPLSVSHRILPEFREYERTSTVVVNAYLQPLMQSYMERLAERATNAGDARIFVMQSSGGITALESAAREPVRTVLSGPAGGLVGAAAMAARSGFRKILSFDMGGTSTDVAAVQGEVRAGGSIGSGRASGGSSHAGDSHRGRGWRVAGSLRCGWGAARGAGIGGRRSGTDLLWPRNRTYGD